MKKRIIAVLIVFSLLLSGCATASQNKNVSDDSETIADSESDTSSVSPDDSSGFILLSEAVPDAILEIRYYSTYNFVGERIDGYDEPLAFLSKEAAQALREVSDELMAKGYRLKIFDAYRPQEAVDHFVEWAEDLDDAKMKEYFYPELEKDEIIPQGYVDVKSGHSRGSTVDLTLFDMKTEKEVDMGGTFDYFGELSHPDFTGITDEQYANRMILRDAMVAHGFRPLDTEWWHFTLENEPYPDTYFTFPINSNELEGAAAPAATSDASKEESSSNGDIMILYTSDVHCGVEQGFGLNGLKQLKDNLESKGYETILVDNGDAIQGEALGMMSKGEAIIELMNEVGYDLAIPGNHEFDYGMDRFFELTEMADFPYISCNLNKEGELVFPKYQIVEANGKKIGFVGVTTPRSLVTSTPALFKNENGEFIYGFLQDETGELVYNAVQEAVDEVRSEGADYVYLMGHLGMRAVDSPWSYADIVSHTSGIDVVLDGHSHDLEHVVMKNKDGDSVVRIACGTKMNAIGYSRISAEDGIVETDVWTWSNSTPFSELFGISNSVSDLIDVKMDELNTELEKNVAKSNVTLTIYDPEEKDDRGNPIRMVRRAETNAGDFCADAYRFVTGAEIALINGGGVRTDITKGDVSYGDILNMNPFNNEVSVIEATGQQILDALEAGSSKLPDEYGGFIHVSGLTYEVDVNVPSGCNFDEDGILLDIQGERRVRNVKVGNEPLDPQKTYTVGGTDYLLLNEGDGITAFNGATLVKSRLMTDNQALIDYVTNGLNGEIGTGYEDPYGEGRIVIIE